MGVETSAVRMELVGSQLIGLAMIRYVLKVEPIASLSVDELVPLMAPPLRQALGFSSPAGSALPARVTRSSPSSPGEPVDCRSTAGGFAMTLSGWTAPSRCIRCTRCCRSTSRSRRRWRERSASRAQALSRMLAAGLVRRVLRGVYVASTALDSAVAPRVAAVGLLARAARHRGRPDGCVGARRARSRPGASRRARPRSSPRWSPSPARARPGHSRRRPADLAAAHGARPGPAAAAGPGAGCPGRLWPARSARWSCSPSCPGSPASGGSPSCARWPPRWTRAPPARPSRCSDCTGTPPTSRPRYRARLVAAGARLVRLSLAVEQRLFGVVLAHQVSAADLLALEGAGWWVVVLPEQRVLTTDPSIWTRHLEREFHQQLLHQVERGGGRVRVDRTSPSSDAAPRDRSHRTTSSGLSSSASSLPPAGRDDEIADGTSGP